MTADDMTCEIPRRVKETTGGQGVPVVYDSVGRDTLMASLDSLQPRGSLVSNGTSSGPVVIDTSLLAVKGSIWVTRPAMVHYATPRSHMLAMAKELFDHVLAGRITGEPKQQYRLEEAADTKAASPGGNFSLLDATMRDRLKSIRAGLVDVLALLERPVTPEGFALVATTERPPRRVAAKAPRRSSR